MSKALIPVSDATEAEIEKAFSTFSSREPVVLAALIVGPVTWLLTNIGALIVGHTHLVTKAQWDSKATTLFPIITAVVVFALTFLIAWLVRRVVKPWWKDLTGRDLAVPARLTSATWSPPTGVGGSGADGSTMHVFAGGGGGGGGGSSTRTATLPGEPDLFDADLADGPDEITGTTSGAPDGADHDPNTPGSSAPASPPPAGQ